MYQFYRGSKSPFNKLLQYYPHEGMIIPTIYTM